jgi:glycosyltransferase involved in cell wall biosynthesis
VAMTPDRDINSGVNKKVISQTLHLINQGIDTDLILIGVVKPEWPSLPDFLSIYPLKDVSRRDIFGRVKRILRVRKIFHDTIRSLGPTDIIYLRGSAPFLCCPFTLLKRFRDCKLVVEHQTMEVDELKLNHQHLEIWFEYLFGKLMRKQSDAIICVTNEITNYQLKHSGTMYKPHLTLGNGFEVNSVSTKEALPPQNMELHLLCVAMVNRWHGLDRLLQGLAAYDGTPKVILHIAGDGPELPQLHKLTNELGIGDRVIFHGFTTGKALDDLFDQCHVAVGSLGIHRIGLKEASILKAREYCARGIPFIYGIADPDFPADFPYILHLPADESPINIDSVLAFAQEVCADPDHPQKMRRYAEEHLDWSVKMRRLKGFLEALVGEDGTKGVPKLSAPPLATTGLKIPDGTALPGAGQGDVRSGASRERGS